WSLTCRWAWPAENLEGERPMKRLLAFLPVAASLAATVFAAPAGAASHRLPPNCTHGKASLVTCTFSYTGSADSFTVPKHVTQVTISASGAQGGGGNFGVPGGTGAQLTSDF